MIIRNDFHMIQSESGQIKMPGHLHISILILFILDLFVIESKKKNRSLRDKSDSFHLLMFSINSRSLNLMIVSRITFSI
jgi:hypothetical protein